MSVEGFQEKQIEGYRQTRMIMFTLVSLLGDSKSKPKTPEALWPLPGDKNSGNESEDELREFYNRYINERSRSKIQNNS